MVPVVNDPKKVILALRWVVNEMEKRYQIFAKVGVRNIKSFNERPKAKPVQQDLFSEKKKEEKLKEKAGRKPGTESGEDSSSVEQVADGTPTEGQSAS